NKNVLLDEMEVYADLVKPGGHLLLSGFYEHDIPDILEKAGAYGLELKDQKSRSDWAALVLEKLRKWVWNYGRITEMIWLSPADLGVNYAIRLWTDRSAGNFASSHNHIGTAPIIIPKNMPCTISRGTDVSCFRP